jgi:hypothetical protein
MTAPNLGSTKLRILECSACSEPVWAEPSGSRVSLRCGYCGFDDERELSTLVVPHEVEETYRGAQRSRRSRRPAVDLTNPPDGIPKRATLARLRAALAAERKRIITLDADSDERVAAEHRVVYCSAVASNVYRTKHDHVRARAILESALESVSEPTQRALVLARLARLAAFDGAPELAERWLASIPKLNVPEISTDVAVARAAIARAQGDPRGALDALGRENADVGAGRVAAMALRVDAHEQLGDMREARRVYRRGSRGNALVFGATLNAFELAPRTRKRTIAVGLLAIGVLLVAVLALGLALQGSLLAAAALIVFALLGAVFVKTM